MLASCPAAKLDTLWRLRRLDLVHAARRASPSAAAGRRVPPQHPQPAAVRRGAARRAWRRPRAGLPGRCAGRLDGPCRDGVRGVARHPAAFGAGRSSTPWPSTTTACWSAAATTAAFGELGWAFVVVWKNKKRLGGGCRRDGALRQPGAAPHGMCPVEGRRSPNPGPTFPIATSAPRPSPAPLPRAPQGSGTTSAATATSSASRCCSRARSSPRRACMRAPTTSRAPASSPATPTRPSAATSPWRTPRPPTRRACPLSRPARSAGFRRRAQPRRCGGVAGATLPCCKQCITWAAVNVKSCVWEASRSCPLIQG
jgi:hypothetical protein